MTSKIATAASGLLDKLTPPSDHLKRLRQLLLPLLLTGLLGALLLGANAQASGAFGVVLLWASACMAGGSLVGFLFGIPRAGLAPAVEKDSADTARSRPNTNLEEVSDWLTKILVGLTLVHLDTARGHLLSLAERAAAGLNANPGPFEQSAALALVVFFLAMGFLAGYLYTRLILQKLIIDADMDAFGYAERVSEVMADAPAAAPTQDGEPVQASDQERVAARRILAAAPLDDPQTALAPVRERARQYEAVRSSLPYSRERTQRMAQIAAELRKLALVSKPHLAQLMASSSPGERLAATCSLQMSFEPQAIEWLADRIHEDSAFIGYQAVSVLSTRMDVAGPPERQRIVKAIEAAQAKGVEPEDARDKLVAALLAKAASR